MNNQNSDGPNDAYSEHDLRESARATWDEFLRHKWRLGVRLGHDPEDDRPVNELFAEWIAQHAAAFRRHWEEQRRRCRAL